MTKKIFVFTLLIFYVLSNVSAQKIFSEVQLKTDLLFYKTKLEEYHPNLYLYSSKEKINAWFDSLHNSINTPLSELEFYQKITLTSALIKDGHTLILPSHSFTNYHNTHSKFIPFQIGLSDQKLYIKMNCTSSSQLYDGILIDSINGISSVEIIQNLLKRQVRDGNNVSYAKWIIDTYFREYYSYVFGHPENYCISYTLNNRSYTIKTPALSKDSIYYHKEKNYSNLFSVQQNNKAIYLKYDTTKRIAIITIKDFHTDILKKKYKQNFIKEIKTMVNDVIDSKAEHLVIDLRDNQGGDVKNGVYLLKYLIPKPFKVVDKYQMIQKGKIVEARGPSMGIHKPFKRQFKGQVYVLLNGGSFSNSVIFSSCLKENSNAIFIGTESGGNPNILAGYAKNFELPNTKINVQIPTKRFIMTNMTKNSGAGLIPIHIVENSSTNFTHQKDNQLDFLLNLIR